MRIAFATFGCKINQVETDGMRNAAAGAGNDIVPFDGDADVYVINTCSVTAKSDYQCRQAIRAAVRRNAGARVIVTGCYAETRGDELKQIPGVALILPNREKASFDRYLPGTENLSRDRKPPVVSPVPTRTRTFLKIQDGCDSRCSYCIVPLARGSSRSVPRDAVVELFDAAVRNGAPEVVLSGIHIGRYGADLVPAFSLSSLVGDLSDRSGGRTRIRLSSIEPTEITPEIVNMLGKGVCRHLHIPLQSGDDEILRLMRRHYTADTYGSMVRNLAKRVPGMAIGADVMVGFPGEGDEEFRKTYDLIESLPITHLHVFSYSRRPGTAAADMKGQVPEVIKRTRNELLRVLGAKKNLEFRKAQMNCIVPAVIEGKSKGTDFLIGVTDNYIRVAVQGAQAAAIGSTLPVRIVSVNEQNTEGSLP